MARSTNTFAEKKKRLPHEAYLCREERFRKADADELEAACRRIAGDGEYLRHSGRRGALDCTVIRFATVDQALAMQTWIDESGIADRPPPPTFDGPLLKCG